MTDSSSIGIRLHESLKDKITKYAKRHSRSINAEIVYRLEESFRPIANIFDELFESLDGDKVLRMRSTSTQADVRRILNVVRHLGIDRIIFGARRDHLNNAVMVFIAQTPGVTLLLDHTDINMARNPREIEVQDVFRELDKLGYLSQIDFCSEYLPETSENTPAEAIKIIVTEGAIKKLSNLNDYLKLLSVHPHYDPNDYVFSS